jgi:hypothetical protein
MPDIIYEAIPNRIDKQDRSNIANARVAGMQTSLKISNYQVELGRLVCSVFYSDTCLFCSTVLL